MASDVPAFLDVGTPVSAKFKGAFCEATIKSVKKLVKFKVQYKDGTGSSIVCDDVVNGEYKLNALVHIKQDDGETKPASIQKMNDHSYYTVVFDDGDERTLKRTNVCVMGERHFQEHENLDNLPLTDPENFLSPVVLSSEKRRKRRRSAANLEEEDSDVDSKRWNTEIDKEFLGKVVCVEQGDRKKSWFPALGVKHFGNHTESQIFVQSFKDGKRLLVNKDDVREFSKTKEPLLTYVKGEQKSDQGLKSAIEKALAYQDMGELPKGWNILDTIDEKEESSDEDVPTTPILSPEDKAFQESVYSFMAKQGNSINKPPLLNNQGVNLHKLYELVSEHGGMDEVTNQQWRSIYKQLGLRNMHTTASYNMKTLYKRYLYPYEEYTKASVSQTRQATSKKRRSGTPAALKDDADKLSTKSESDSEPERRRSTRGVTRSSNADKTPEVNERKRRSQVALVTETNNDNATDNKEAPKRSSLASAEQETKSETEDVDVINSPQSSTTSDENDIGVEGGKEETPDNNRVLLGKFKIGSKISVRYGNGKNQRTYTAKILEVDKDDIGDIVYYIHYNGWNHRYDEWIKESSVFELIGTTNIKQKKNPNPPTSLSKISKEPPQRYKAAKLEVENTTATNITPSSTTQSHQTTTSSIATTSLISSVDNNTATTSSLTSTVINSNLTISSTSSASSSHITTTEVLSTKVLSTKSTIEVLSLPPLLVNAAKKVETQPPKLPRVPPTEPLTVKCKLLQTSEKLPSPIKSPAIPPDAVFLSELSHPIKSTHHAKHAHHRPKPVNDALFIPDIKPSPVKPRLTRNSMQDTFLLNALEQSIGKQNQAAMTLQQDVLMKSEPPVLSRRRSNRQNPSPKLDHQTDSDNSSKEDIKEVEITPKEIIKPIEEIASNGLSSFENKVTCKEENVKKWIEDSNNVIKKEVEVEDNLPVAESLQPNDDKTNIKRGRKVKARKNEKKKKPEESDSENETKSEQAEETVNTESPKSSENNNLLTEKDRTSETATTLSDFCNIVQNVQKLESHPSVDSITLIEEKSFEPSQIKGEKKIKKPQNKRKRTHSVTHGDDGVVKSPKEKREKQMSPPLEYNADFVSDLSSVLAEKSSVDRIAIMQSRLNQMRKLYCKLRQEVASIDRRKRRKLRKQMETRKGNS